MRGVIRDDIESNRPPPAPTSTPTQQQQAERAERQRERINRMSFAGSCAVEGNFDRDRMVQPAEYDYGAYAGIIVESYHDQKSIARQRHNYRSKSVCTLAVCLMVCIPS